jgi:hypothetical protein
MSHRKESRESRATHSSEGDNEGSKVVLDVEGFHHTAVDLLNHRGTIARNVAVVGEGVKSS